MPKPLSAARRRASAAALIAALSGWLVLPAVAAPGDRHATADAPAQHDGALDKATPPSPRRTLLASCLPPPALTFPPAQSVDRPLMVTLRARTTQYIADEDNFQSCVLRYIIRLGPNWPDQAQYAEYRAAADALVSESQTRKENVGLAFNQLAQAYNMKAPAAR